MSMESINQVTFVSTQNSWESIKNTPNNNSVPKKTNLCTLSLLFLSPLRTNSQIPCIPRRQRQHQRRIQNRHFLRRRQSQSRHRLAICLLCRNKGLHALQERLRFFANWESGWC